MFVKAPCGVARGGTTEPAVVSACVHSLEPTTGACLSDHRSTSSLLGTTVQQAACTTRPRCLGLCFTKV